MITPPDVARRRAAVQALSKPRRETPEKLVAWLGGVQSQEYALAKWSIAQRLAGGTIAAVEAAVARGTILRTHILRPTWHFVPRDDLRWMQRLTSPRVLALMAYNDRRNGVSAAMVETSTKTIAASLDRGRLTRPELAEALGRAGIRTNPWLLSQLVIHA